MFEGSSTAATGPILPKCPVLASGRHTGKSGSVTWAAALFHRLADRLTDPQIAWLRLAGAAGMPVVLTADVRQRQPVALVVAEYVVFGATALGALFAVVRQRPRAYLPI